MNDTLEKVLDKCVTYLQHESLNSSICVAFIVFALILVFTKTKKQCISVEINALKSVLNSSKHLSSSSDLLDAIEHALLSAQSKRELELTNQIDDLIKEKKRHDDLLNSVCCTNQERIKEPPSILSSSTEDENCTYLDRQIISIGLSKTVSNSHSRHSIIYEKNLTNNQYADDDEDIVVIDTRS